MMFENYLKHIQKDLNKTAEHFLDSEQRHFHEGLDISLIKSSIIGGKRLRPAALILAYESLKRPEKRILLPALAIELQHTYSVILDDVMDEDIARRGLPTANAELQKKFDKRKAYSFAVMLGNITGILSKRAIMQSEFDDLAKYKALGEMEKYDLLLYQGQMLDMLYEDTGPSEQEYLEMTGLKTGSLFSLAFRLGAIFAEADEHTIHLIGEFGMHCAISFQLQDDLLDLSANKGRLPGSDIRKGKKTLLYIKASEKAKVAGTVDQIIDIYVRTGAVDYCRHLASKEQRKAVDILSQLKVDRRLFTEFANFMGQRSS